MSTTHNGEVIVGGLYQTPEWTQEEIMESSQTRGKDTKTVPRTWREEAP